ncbi:MAG TPA: magnesium transporter CorA family protein [Caulobacteraceae bacterium]
MITAFPKPDESRLEDAVWIDLTSPSEDEVSQVELATGLTVPSREEVSAIEASSRLQRVGKALYLSAPLLTAGDTVQLSPAGFVLTPERLITLRFDKVGAFDLAAGHMTADPDVTGFGAFTCLFESIVDKLADGLELLGAELDHVSHKVFHQKDYRRGAAKELGQRQTLAKVGRIGERLSQVRDVLLSVGRIVPFVLEVRQGETPEPIAARLKAVRQDIASLNDYEAHLANKVQFLLDAVLGFINISQNDIFKVLTVWSIVGIPPTLVAGIYGMNFKSMPELNWAWGYPFGWALILISALIPLGWFKWKGWV